MNNEKTTDKRTFALGHRKRKRTRVSESLTERLTSRRFPAVWSRFFENMRTTLQA